MSGIRSSSSKRVCSIAGRAIALPERKHLRQPAKTHTVLVTEDGFEYEGERCHSLTQIARQITGAHWSGPRFFRVRPRGSRSLRGE